jgi:hypothetical protein
MQICKYRLQEKLDDINSSLPLNLVLDDAPPTHFKIGMIAAVKGKEPVIQGIVAFVGLTSFASGHWIGLVLDDPVGKNDGTVQAIQYFKCKPKHGLFVRPGQLNIVDIGDSMKFVDARSESPPTTVSDTGTATKDGDAFEYISSTNNNKSRDNVVEYSMTQEISSLPPMSERITTERFKNTLALTSKIKSKLANSMVVLNKQLEAVESFERYCASTTGDESDSDKMCNDLFQTVYKLSVEEWKMLKEYVDAIKLHKKICATSS